MRKFFHLVLYECESSRFESEFKITKVQGFSSRNVEAKSLQLFCQDFVELLVNTSRL